MKRSLLLLLIPAAAAAQPITQPSPCEVTISRAPDDVRDAIEAWVKAEPRCTTTLDVRVVPTEGGLYLFARDGAGRVRERVVPDAQAAGVLVASWVADDVIAPPSTTPPPVEPFLPMPPSATAPVVAPTAPIGTTAVSEPARASRWLTLGGIWQLVGDSGGLRAELDLVHRGRWSVGAVLAGTSTEINVHDATGYMTAVELRLLATLAYTMPLGKKWEVRVAAGGGVMTTRATGRFDNEDIEATGVFPTAEASALLSREIYGDWAFGVGPVAIWYMQTYKFQDDLGTMITMSNRDHEVLVFTGVRRRL